MPVKRSWFVVSVSRPLGLLVALGLPATAAGDPEPLRAGTELPAVAGGEAQLVAQLRDLEAGRRKLRTEALKEPESWAVNRPTRAVQHRQQVAQLWGDVVGSIDGQASLRINADRMARLNRMLDLAQQAGDATLIARLQGDITRELTRHAHTMLQVIVLSGSK